MNDSPGSGSSKKDEDDSQKEPTGEIQRVNIKLPPFWSNSPSAWFVQTEAQFQIGRITSDASKYNHVIASLPQDVAETILDVLEEPPVSDLYKNLKQILINRHSLSIERRVKKLISAEEMGDKRPSEFYRTLKQLAGTTSNGTDDLIRNIWSGRLPNLVNIALIPQKDQTIDKVLPVADQVWEALQSNRRIKANDRTNEFYW